MAPWIFMSCYYHSYKEWQFQHKWPYSFSSHCLTLHILYFSHSAASYTLLQTCIWSCYVGGMLLEERLSFLFLCNQRAREPCTYPCIHQQILTEDPVLGSGTQSWHVPCLQVRSGDRQVNSPLHYSEVSATNGWHQIVGTVADNTTGNNTNKGTKLKRPQSGQSMTSSSVLSESRETG